MCSGFGKLEAENTKPEITQKLKLADRLLKSVVVNMFKDMQENVAERLSTRVDCSN